MKKIFVILIVFIVFDCQKKTQLIENIVVTQPEITIYEQEIDLLEEARKEYNYGDFGNGNIDGMQWSKDGEWTTYRKHIDKGEVYTTECLKLYDKLSEIDGRQLVTTLDKSTQIRMLEIAITENKIDGKIIYWLNIAYIAGHESWTYGGDGWIYGGEGDPYADGNGAILEVFDTGNKNWTVRKVRENVLYAINHLNVRDKPGLDGSNVLFQIIDDENNTNGANSVTVLALTVERETIDTATDFWVKIRDKQGREGWVFGGYLTVSDVGGAKYYTPEAIVRTGLTLE